MQNAGGNRRTIAARAMDCNAPVTGDFANALLQVIQGNIHAAIDVLGRPLARIPDIQHQRRVHAR